MRQTAIAGVLALLVLTAGCLGGTTDPDPQPEQPPVDDGSEDVQTATINFYLSDEKNAIEDFRHVNVTVTEVSLVKQTENNSTTKKTVDVSDTTVDITRLQGENATMIDRLNVSNGTYTKVFLHVGEVNATLKNGERVNVKLPSQKLHLTSSHP